MIYIVLIMSPDANLFAYRGRGRPNARSSQLPISAFLQKELCRLHREMAYKKGAEILLAVSAASDEMVRVVHMFPQVFYIDNTTKASAIKHQTPKETALHMAKSYDNFVNMKLNHSTDEVTWLMCNYVTCVRKYLMFEQAISAGDLIMVEHL